MTMFPIADVFDDFDWIRNCGPTPSETTGPENDHTRGQFLQDVPNAACSGNSEKTAGLLSRLFHVAGQMGMLMDGERVGGWLWLNK